MEQLDINTWIMIALGLVIVMRDIFYSKKRIEAKDDAIKAKEAEIASLKSSIQSKNDLHDQREKLYNSETIEKYVQLSENKAQLEAENNARKLIKEEVEQKDKEISELKIKLKEVETKVSTKNISAHSEVRNETNENENVHKLFEQIQIDYPKVWRGLELMLSSMPLTEFKVEDVVKSPETLEKILIDLAGYGYLKFRWEKNIPIDIYEYDGKETTQLNGDIILVNQVTPELKEALANYWMFGSYQDIKLTMLSQYQTIIASGNQTTY